MKINLIKIVLVIGICFTTTTTFADEPAEVKVHKEEGVVELIEVGVSKFFHDVGDSQTMHRLMFWKGEKDLEKNSDPWEGFNRSIYGFNATLDGVVLKPVARVYRGYTPPPIKTVVGNFFANIGDINTMINQILQFKLYDGAKSIGRLAVNSTIGLGGLLEVQKRPSQREDFGQTLGVWGVDSGPYLVLPFFGPSSLRDGVGFVPDTYVASSIIFEVADSDTQGVVLSLVNTVQSRSKILPLTDLLEKTEDPYISARNAYLQKRAYDVADGNIGLDEEEF